jgi:hypothetical protein
VGFVVRVAAAGHQFRQTQTYYVAGLKGQHCSRVKWDKHHAASQQRNAAWSNAWPVRKVRPSELFRDNDKGPFSPAGFCLIDQYRSLGANA